MAGSVARITVSAAMGIITACAGASAAWAHGEGETTEGYVLVQQALGHLAHGTSMSTLDLAMEKVDDALETEDQEGVDVAELEQGMAALEAHDVDRARTLLQDSIQEAVAALPPATGNETGTHQIPLELEGRPDLRAQDGGLLAASALALVLGAWLSFLFRPLDSIRTLRARLATLTPDSGDGEEGP